MSVRSCPNCRTATAVNKSEVQAAYHSKYYAKLRKENKRNNLPKQKLPQVGRLPTVEDAMLDPKYEHLVKPTKPPWRLSSDDDFFDKVKFGLVGLLFLWGLILGYERNFLAIVIAVFLVIMFWVESKAFDWSWEQRLARMEEERKTWLCLKCKQAWVESSNVKTGDV